MRTLAQEIANCIQARKTCIEIQNTEWITRHEERIRQLVKGWMPTGAGFDCGTEIDLETSHANKLVFTTSFHHMDENGFYDGWTSHTVTVYPDLLFGIRLAISGRNRDNDHKDYVHEVFSEALTTVI